MADVIGIRDDMYIGKGNKYMHEVVDSVTQGNKDGVLVELSRNKEIPNPDSNTFVEILFSLM